MPEGNYDRTNWTPADIERYISGQMPDAERHALERAMLDDPFLADAVDGLRLRTAAERKTDMDILSKKISDRTDEKVRRIGGASKWWWAAAALLIMVGGTWYWQTQQNSAVPEIAQQTKHEAAPVVTPAESKADSPTTVNPQPATNNQQPATDNRRPTTDNSSSVSASPRSPSVAPDNRPARQVQTDDRADLAKIASAPPPQPQAKKAIVQAESVVQAPGQIIVQDKAAIHNFRGRVVDDKGQGVPFTNISLAGGGPTTYTDAKGEFRIMSQDSSITLIAHAVGFQNAKSEIHIGQPNALILMTPASAALSEVVVTGVGAKKKKERAARAAPKPVSANETEDDEEEESEPVDGWAKYEHYLNNNNRLVSPDPHDASPEVEILFLVSPNGTPYDMKVERSSSPKYEQEALRLLREGPKWQSAKPGKKPLKGYLTLQF